MIRFLPDTWREALLRPIAIAAPDAGVYIEIMAPDFRFAVAMALICTLAVLWVVGRRSTTGTFKPVTLLLALTVASMVPWMLTTANGRYFIPYLLAIGPLCIGLVYLLPATRFFRLALAIGVVGLQGFAVQQATPWQSWGLAQWKDAPYFQVDWPPDLADQPADYVTLSTISYSLLAPQLPPRSRWMSLANAPALPNDSPDASREQSFLTNARNLKLLAPSVPDFSDTYGNPNTEVLEVIDSHLAEHRLALTRPADCRLVKSRGLASMALRREALLDIEKTRKLGFWVCSVTNASASNTPLQNKPTALSKYADVFDVIERQCPRFFPAGQSSTREISGGVMRNYSGTEMKLYALDNGLVFYKYYRAFNPVKIGTTDDVRSGNARMDCNHIRGRSGLPWEREI